MAVTLSHYLSVAAILFTLGIFGIFINRKNVIVLLMCIELMLLSVNINFVAFSRFLGDVSGQIFVFFILTVAAAEAAIVAAGAAAMFALLPGYLWLVLAALVYEFSFVLDCADGHVARLKKIASPLGLLLDFLMEHGNRPEFTFRFRYEKGSIAFWDNRSVQHLAIPDYPERRIMYRATLRGDVPR